MDLELASLDDIAEELKKRSIAAIMVVLMKDKTDNTKEVFQSWWKGGFSTCCGLAGRMNAGMLKHANEDVEAIDGD